MAHTRKTDMSDVYDKSPEDEAWRLEDLNCLKLSLVVPNVPRIQKRQQTWLPSKFLKAQEKLVAGVRNAPNTPTLIVPYRFELVREVAL